MCKQIWASTWSPSIELVLAVDSRCASCFCPLSVPSLTHSPLLPSAFSIQLLRTDSSAILKWLSDKTTDSTPLLGLFRTFHLFFCANSTSLRSLGAAACSCAYFSSTSSSLTKDHLLGCVMCHMVEALRESLQPHVHVSTFCVTADSYYPAQWLLFCFVFLK